MAQFCDVTAKAYAEIFKEAGDASTREISSLAEQAKTEAQKRRTVIASQIHEQWGMH
jgi:hypothetical protein